MIVADASVIIKWVRIETDSDTAKKLQKAHLRKEEQIVIPRLALYEISNTLATKYPMTDREIRNGFDFVFRCNLKIFQEDNMELLNAALLARKYSTSVYDMLYAVIAKKQKTILITADERFIQKTKFPFVKLLSEYKI